MKKRLMLWSGFLVLITLVGFVMFLWATAPTHRITKENVDKIRTGMSEAEVERIFGVPAGDYSTPTGETPRIYPSHDLFIPNVPATAKNWKSDRFAVTIWFDDERGNVFYTRVDGESPDTFIEKMRCLVFGNRIARPR